MSGATTAVVAAAAVAGAAISYKNGQEQSSNAKKAAAQSQSAADKLYAQQDQENNKANARGPDTDALLAANQQEAQAGQSGTMLTGPMGVDPNDLALGKNTVLGGATAS